MAEALQYKPDKIHITKNTLKFSGNVFILQDEYGFYLAVSPTADIVGYGKTEEEARQSFLHQVKVFLDDLANMSAKEQKEFLQSLGWKKERLKNKDFTCSFVDKDGKLNNFDFSKSKLETIEVGV